MRLVVLWDSKRDPGARNYLVSVARELSTSITCQVHIAILKENMVVVVVISMIRSARHFLVLEWNYFITL
jgi:hypothetical protein